MRHKITKFMRDFFDDKGFLEVETPILLKGTPEGAREFLVPSRLYPGKFYVLPQSPQQLKQLLMVAGFDRYFQIARCFRDEDQRGDRQPEFTQLDIEMSFVNSHDVMNMIEDMVLKLVSTFYPDRPVLSTPMPRMTWHEAMEKYGSDRPDLRFGMEIVDVAEAVKGSEFQVFQKTLDEKGSIKALCVKGGANFSRKDIDDLTEIAKGQGAKGLAYITFTNEGPKSPILKFLSDEIVKKVETICQAKEGDIVFFAADEFLTACQSLGSVRLEIGKKMHLQDENVLAFCWVYNFPLYERDKQTGGLTSSHHPFTHPLIEHLALLDSEPEKVLGEQYDIVLNGVEIGGGTIRIHVPDLQKKIFQILGISDEDAERRFGHMLKAFGYGAPPHGGIALGLDRVIMILQKEPNIREIIPFPKDQKAKDLMTGAPDIVPDAQIREACIMVPEEYKIAAEE